MLPDYNIETRTWNSTICSKSYYVLVVTRGRQAATCNVTTEYCTGTNLKGDKCIMSDDLLALYYRVPLTWADLVTYGIEMIDMMDVLSSSSKQ